MCPLATPHVSTPLRLEVGSSSVGVAIRSEKQACGRKHVCIVQVDANALMVAAPCYDLVAACLLSLSVCLVVVFIVCSSPLRMCLLSLSGCLVCLLGFVRPGGHLSVGCHLGVKSRNGLHGIWLHITVVEPVLMHRTCDIIASESLATNHRQPHAGVHKRARNASGNA